MRGGKRKSDRRTSGWWGGAWPAEISCQLVNTSVKDKERRPCLKYDKKWMWKKWNVFFFLFCKEIGSRGRKEGRNSALVMSALHFFSAWLVGTSQWLLGCIWCREVWGQSCSEWTAQRVTQSFTVTFFQEAHVSLLWVRGQFWKLENPGEVIQAKFGCKLSFPGCLREITLIRNWRRCVDEVLNIFKNMILILIVV